MWYAVSHRRVTSLPPILNLRSAHERGLHQGRVGGGGSHFPQLQSDGTTPRNLVSSHCSCLLYVLFVQPVPVTKFKATTDEMPNQTVIMISPCVHVQVAGTSHWDNTVFPSCVTCLHLVAGTTTSPLGVCQPYSLPVPRSQILKQYFAIRFNFYNLPSPIRSKLGWLSKRMELILASDLITGKKTLLFCSWMSTKIV